MIQASPLWKFLRGAIQAGTTEVLAIDRVQPLQILQIVDYERLMGMVEAGESLPALLRRTPSGLFRERDFASWLCADPHITSADARLSTLKTRWDEMSQEVLNRQQHVPKAGDHA